MAGGLVIMPRVLAQSPLDLNASDALRSAIAPHVGQRLRLKLVSGQDLEGQVVSVGSSAVALTQLAGMEFFDATVRLDQVAAVIVRRPK
jgi:hypothetical protein